MRCKAEISARQIIFLYAGLAILAATGMDCPPERTNRPTLNSGPITPTAASNIPGGFYYVTRANAEAWVWLAGSQIDQGPFDLTGAIRRFDTDGWPMTCDGRIYDGYVDEVINGRPMTVISIQVSPLLRLSDGLSGPGVTVRYELQQQDPNPNDILPIYEGTGVVKTIYVGKSPDGSLYSERDFVLGDSSVYGIEVHSQEWQKTSQAQFQEVCE